MATVRIASLVRLLFLSLRSLCAHSPTPSLHSHSTHPPLPRSAQAEHCRGCCCIRAPLHHSAATRCALSLTPPLPLCCCVAVSLCCCAVLLCCCAVSLCCVVVQMYQAHLAAAANRAAQPGMFDRDGDPVESSDAWGGNHPPVAPVVDAMGRASLQDRPAAASSSSSSSSHRSVHSGAARRAPVLEPEGEPQPPRSSTHGTNALESLLYAVKKLKQAQYNLTVFNSAMAAHIAHVHLPDDVAPWFFVGMRGVQECVAAMDADLMKLDEEYAKKKQEIVRQANIVSDANEEAAQANIKMIQASKKATELAKLKPCGSNIDCTRGGCMKRASPCTNNCGTSSKGSHVDVCNNPRGCYNGKGALIPFSKLKAAQQQDEEEVADP